MTMVSRLVDRILAPARPDIVVFDTETTGVSAQDRVVSLGAVRLGPDLRLKRSLHLVFNPERDSHWAAERVHGLAAHYLSRQPLFAEHLAEVRDFFAGAALAAHNLDFDTRMMNRELALHGAAPLDPRPGARCTMLEWRARGPGGPAGLDAAIGHLGLVRQGRVHGAFEDAVLAASVLRFLDGLPHAPCGPLIPPANERPAESPDLPAGPPVKTLAGARVVLTGELASLGRDEAVAALARCGARRQSAPNRLTDFVVMGAAPGPAKLRAIRQLQQEHGRPRVLPEAVFLRLIGGAG